MKRRAAIFLAAGFALVCCARAGEAVDLEMLTRIKHEGFENSRVMETLSQLADVSGPRLTGSPGLKAASEWSRRQLSDWGLQDSHLEPWGEFGKGWSLERFSLAMTKPYFSPLIALPRAWTASVGKFSGSPMIVEIQDESNFGDYKGKLKDAIVMLPMVGQVELGFEADAKRLTDKELEETAMAPELGGPSDRERRRAEFRRLFQLRRKIYSFLRDEGVRLVLEASRGAEGTINVSGGRPSGEDSALPVVVVSAEQFGRMERLLKLKVPVVLEGEMETRFYDDDLQAYNVVATIPGTDPDLKDELVMLGGHIDSWHAGDGATDNGAGVAVAMEAVRILQAVGAKPRRTIRIGLWSGEEQGLLGSKGYVKEHFGDPKTMALKPEHERLSAYFNLDNGAGKIRGVYLQGNDAVRPIFEAYLRPFHDLGASTLSIRNTGGTDHLSFDAVGLPGFQFIQDPLDYDTRTHHTNMDLLEHAPAGDLMQASVIMASFVYNAAMRDARFPRKPLPEAEKPATPEAPAADATSGSRR